VAFANAVASLRHWPLGGGEASPSTLAGVYTQTAKAKSGVPFTAPAQAATEKWRLATRDSRYM